MIKRVDENGNVRLITNIRKPRKWKRFEYIQGVSGCKIDTGQHGHMNFTYEVKFLAVNGITKEVWYVQDGDTYYKLVLSLTYGANSTGRFWMTYWSASDTNSNIKLTDLDSDIHIAKVSNGYWYWDGVSKGRTVQHSDSFVTTNTINILPNNYNKIYYFKIWDNTDILLHEYVPAQYNGQYGMWDLVEDKFYPNKGTGTFTVGPEMKNYDEIYEVKKAYSILPSGVELYDYILSNGTLYFDSGWVTNYTKNFEITSKYNASSSGSRACILSGHNATNALSLEIAGNTSRYWLHNGQVDNSISIAAETDHISIFSYGGGTWKHQVDGGTANTGSVSYSDSAAGSAFMFVDRALRYSTFNKTFKMYYLTIKENGILIRNMLPCTYLGEPGMWDTVENKFYRNQGTGLFTLGNKITLKEYEYLLSASSGWINTNYIPTFNTKVKTKINIVSNSAAAFAFGSRIGVGNLAYYVYYQSNRWYYCAGSLTNTITQESSRLAEIEYSIPVVKINTLVLNTNLTTFTSTKPIYLFGINTNGSMDNLRGTELIYYFLLYENNQLVRDFIPVSYNGTPGLWDKVEWKFYANAGSGSFTLGPEKVSGIYYVQNTPITDGLIFHLDCRKLCSETTWTDLVGGVTFTGNNIILENGVPYFNGSNSYYSSTSNSNILNTRTLEIVFKKQDTLYYMLYSEDFGSTSGTPYFGIGLTPNYTIMKSGQYSLLNNDEFYTLTIPIYSNSRGLVYKNGEIFSPTNDINYWSYSGLNRIEIGHRPGNSSFYLKGYIYAIRIYNRVLTESEIKYNHIWDKKTYNSWQ